VSGERAGERLENSLQIAFVESIDLSRLLRPRCAAREFGEKLRRQ
jgi:hypothetical protein